MSSSLENAIDRANLAEFEAEQKRQEYREARMLVIRPSVIEFIKNDRPDLDYESAIGLICTWLMDHNRQATDANIRAAIAQTRVQPKVLSEAEQRQDLQAKLIAEGASSTLIAKFQDMTLAQLQAKLEELKNVNRWKGMSHTELQAEVKRQVPAGVMPLAPGTPILEPHISRRALAHYSPDELRKLKRAMDQRHGLGVGEIAISARLSGADADEIKRLYASGF